MSLNKIKKTLGISETAFIQDENTLQDFLAPIIRKNAMQHLAESQEVVAKSFRGEYIASGLGHYKDFIKTQSQNGAWGTYIEATAIGEALGFHIVVTPIKNGAEQSPICLYRAAKDNAPMIHLYNRDNIHWFYHSKKPTKGNGNCLFNAIAQALKNITKPELKQFKNENKASAVKNTNALFGQTFSQAELNILKTRQKLETSIFKKQTPQEMKAECEAEKIRIQKLSRFEQQQIENDHKLALQLALEDELSQNQIQRRIRRF